MPLNPPPTSPTWDFEKFKDWFFKLWKEFQSLTFGGGSSTYSAAIFASASNEGASLTLSGNQFLTFTVNADTYSLLILSFSNNAE